MSPKLQPVRGTHDILPEENRLHRHVADTWRRVSALYGYGEISTPIFEFSDVFHRTLGDTSDVVTKETYTFEDRGGESITLRPEFTAACVRAFLSNGLQNELPIKWAYYGPAFRYERPQKGRLRQFHQIGAELLGVAGSEGDIEMILMGYQFLKELGIHNNIRVEINTLGDAESRQQYRAKLVEYFTQHKDKLSDDSKMRLEKNPLRILDSKAEQDQVIIKNAPPLQDSLSAEAQAFFDMVRGTLDGLGIATVLNRRLVRGLDYYQHTVFEFVAEDGLGSQNTVLAGGRYDGLVKLMGGPEVAGVGFAAGVERICTLLDAAKLAEEARPVAVMPLGEGEAAKAWEIAQSLREGGVAAELLVSGNLGKRMKRADKMKARFAVVIGEDEMKRGVVTVKHLDSGEQKEVKFDALDNELRSAA